MGQPIGLGKWTPQMVGRGGTPLRSELAWTSMSVSYVLNGTGSARVTIPAQSESGTTCCEALANSDPYRDELVLWRDHESAWAGPLTNISSTREGGQAQASDLSHWLDLRFIGDFHGHGDSGDVFRAIFENAMSGDPSPNLDLSSRRTGEITTLDFKETEYHRAADALRDLSTYAVDWTVVGRMMLAGGEEIFQGDRTLIIHDDGVTAAEITREGANLATDIAVFGAPLESAAGSSVSGRAVRSTERYGLIQRSFTHLLVRDQISAAAAATSYLESVQPAPIRLRVDLTQGAGFQFSDLIPGRRFDVRLEKAAGCMKVEQEMRLQQVDVEIGPGSEKVTLALIPLGITEENL